MSTSLSFPEYKAQIKALKTGKVLPSAIYLHKSALETALPAPLKGLVFEAIEFLQLDQPWNVLKLFKRDLKFTLLHYPDFDSYAYPALYASTTVDVIAQSVKCTDYTKSANPPILHRKETFVLPSHPGIDTFKAITAEGEAIGLYENTKTIGFKQQWEKLIKRKGYKLDEQGRLQAVQEPKECAEQALKTPKNSIQRHLTAINRDRLSAPFQKLAKFGYLAGDHSILDYGCGLGDDATELEAHGLNINAWDPVHRSSGNKVKSDIVNLGFVLNVIEDYPERIDTLRQAFEHCNKLLVVSVMLINSSVLEQFKPFKDGVITKRNTFQKYYSQAQIREFIKDTLHVKTTPFGQGIIAVFKCPELEEQHHAELQFQSHNWQHITQRPTPKSLPTAAKQSLFEKHQPLFEEFWQHCLHYGRIPANEEFEQSDALRAIIGSHNKAFALLQSQYDQQDMALARNKRKQDLLVYFALSLFGKRQAKSHLPTQLMRDIKSHFESFNQAIDEAKALLFSVSDTRQIGQACHDAYEELKLGELIDSHSYILPRSHLNQLPAILRVYVGCAAQLYGDLDEIDLIKIHMRSGKVTLLKYDDYNKKLPLLTERIKVKLLEQDIDYFNYGTDYPLQPLYNKIDFLTPGTKEHKAQQRFDKKLADMLKGVPKAEWPNWDILQKVFEYWGVELRTDKFYMRSSSTS